MQTAPVKIILLIPPYYLDRYTLTWHTANIFMKNLKVFKNSLNLYKFIRLMLGQEISDRQIARRWKMDEKNFHEFKKGNYPVPRLSRLSALAKVLGVDTYVVCQVAEGEPALKVFRLIKSDNHNGLIKLLSAQLYAAHQSLTKQEKQCRLLFEHANDSILVADANTGEIIDCNKEAERLLGRPKTEIIGMNRINLHPLEKKNYYNKHFRKHVKAGQIVEQKKQYVLRKDGAIIPVLISARVIHLHKRKVIQGIFRDVSGQKK
jgi:PAS domain S-box-containing protein